MIPENIENEQKKENTTAKTMLCLIPWTCFTIISIS